LAYEAALAAAFSPHAPINRKEFFRGRFEQIRAATDTIMSPGLHAVIYGNRGVGKTSLANILGDFLEKSVVATSRVICGHSDTFEDVIRRALEGLGFQTTRYPTGFVGERQSESFSVADQLPADGRLAPDSVARVLSVLPPYVVLVIDEFDRLRPHVTASFADLLKAMSDRGAETTLVLVGVASSVDGLIANHASVERCIRQIQLQRMSDGEIEDIIKDGYTKAGFVVKNGRPILRIIRTAQGFPHYGHLLAQNAARAALDNARNTVTEEDAVAGMDTAVQNADQSHRDLYHKAVTATRKSLWPQVVTACALARSDERGFFSGRAVQDALGKILDREVQQQQFAFHLGKLIEEDRGPLLHRTGPERRYRYQFANPLMRPFIIMKAVADGIIIPE